jgi:hypothetical protein
MRLLATLACLLLLAACGNPVPAEKAAYVGEWEDESMYLAITQSGKLIYERVEGNNRKSVEGPIKAFTDKGIEVGVGPIATTFVVNKPPYREGESWKMVVDGVTLTRKP